MKRDEQRCCGERPVTIYTESLHHPYVARTSEVLLSVWPDLRFLSWPSHRWALLTGRRDALLHLQWISVVRRRSAVSALVGSVKIVGFLALVRLLRVPIVWTIHNPVGKSTDRVLADRLLRTLIVALCRRCVVLNEGAIDQVRAEVLGPFRRQLIHRLRVVPMPMRLGDHGAVVDKEIARNRLGLPSDLPIVLYAPGSNQRDRSSELYDRHDRYRLVRVARDLEPSGLVQTERGWEQRGRPSDSDYGLLLSAADAIVLTDGAAFGSMTVHAAVEFRRFVISPDCPAAQELDALGAAAVTMGPITPDWIAEVLPEAMRDLDAAFDAFEAAHSDDFVAAALEAVYLEAGLRLPVS